ncbi:MAG: UDP-N-acetylmuramoyl-L-alanine--D-glutamate ligase [Verrucomicrobia bacterium]|nr:UDP-N-acetylmuramoyl-L-alanine--D-glutamate ligase [Verrucomicrobiota bacterium]MBU6445901.1 UDP-N-acetylmuramoyl-L-alanine--D-glutamate ligase [Verrucomicrobiota bacterium]MDE3047157.1 UDP-N-acetylmuramoyl-L-alanine--D-glutamate ligase [Verrucomicrobiota bacterium]
MRKVLVVGYGVSGKAAAAFLRARGDDVVVVDQKGGEGVLSDTADIPLHEFQQVIVSPGIPPTHPLVQKAQERGIEVIGEMELGCRHLQNRCFGITGSNGKTTTVTLVAHLLNAAGKKARALGNVGDSLCHYLLHADPEEIILLELSSFQLETLHAPVLEAALVLNITPNHLDRHRDMQEYASAKARIQCCVKEGGSVYVSDAVLDAYRPLFPNAQTFEKELALIEALSYTQLEMPSKQSVQAAYLLCKRCGVTDAEFLRGLTRYKKPPHRIEWVAEINGVAYYNDSKSSNIHSVLHAVERIEGPVILLIGGVHKGASYKPWITPFQGKVRQMIAYGKAAPIMEYELAPYFPFVGVDRFADAVKLAKQMAKKPEAVLLSPGCSSYDQFENYEQRGDEFKRLVREL